MNEVRPERSILSHLLDLYDTDVRIRLNETYRLNRELCQLPSRLWYDGDLRSAPGHATSRLALPPSPMASIRFSILNGRRHSS